MDDGCSASATDKRPIKNILKSLEMLELSLIVNSSCGAQTTIAKMYTINEDKERM